MWISPVFPKAASPSALDSATGFKSDLIQYLKSYNMPALAKVAESIRHYDMSSARFSCLSFWLPYIFFSSFFLKKYYLCYSIFSPEFVSLPRPPADTVDRQNPVMDTWSSVVYCPSTAPRWMGNRGTNGPWSRSFPVLARWVRPRNPGSPGNFWRHLVRPWAGRFPEKHRWIWYDGSEFGLFIHRLIDWLIDWLIVRSINWLIDWLFDRLIGRLIDWLIDWLIDPIEGSNWTFSMRSGFAFSRYFLLWIMSDSVWKAGREEDRCRIRRPPHRSRCTSTSFYSALHSFPRAKKSRISGWWFWPFFLVPVSGNRKRREGMNVCHTSRLTQE